MTLRRSFLLLALATTTTAHATIYGIHNNAIADYSTRTFIELQNYELVKQRFDYSCGAASLTTILKYQFDIEIDERTVVEDLLNSAQNPDYIRKHGFSLLDLKRYAQLWGVQSSGYSGLSVDELIQKGLPAIIPITMDGYNHFVVFKGGENGHIYLGDPSWGNVLMEARQFEKHWPSKIAFFLYSENQAFPNKLNDSEAYMISDWQHPTYTHTLAIPHAFPN